MNRARAEKQYVGKSKVHTFPDGNHITKIWITPDGLETLNRNADEKGNVNLILAEMRAPDRVGNTHTIYVDTFKPKPQGGNAGQQYQEQQPRQYQTQPQPQPPQRKSYPSAPVGGEFQQAFRDDEQEVNNQPGSEEDQIPF